MTKNVNNKTFQTFKEPSSGGRYESSNPDGDVILNITGSNFGSPATTVVYSTLANGNIGALVKSSDPEIGSFTSLVSGYQTPQYIEGDGSSGMAGTEGGTTSAVNRRCGWQIILPAFDTYFASYQMMTPDYILGQPEQRTFYGSAIPRTTSPVSSWKPLWISDGALDTAGKADIVVGTWNGVAWAVDGNDSANSIGMGSDYTFNEWNSRSCYQEPGANPTVDNGVTEAVFSSPGNGSFENIVTDQPTFSGVATAQYTHVNIQGWRGEGDQDLGMGLFRYFYLAVGANSRARIELSDSAVYTDSNQRITIPYDTWNDTDIATLPVDSKQREGMTHYHITNASGTRQSGLIEDVI